METIVKIEKQVGGCLLSYLPKYSINVLTQLFGKPEIGPNPKIQHQWTVSFQQNGEEIWAFRIYDYYGDRWHLGGEWTGKIGCSPYNKYVDSFKDTLKEMVKNLKK